MIGAVVKLIRIRLRLAWNTFRHGSFVQKFGWLIGILGALAFAVGIGLFCWFFFRLITSPLLGNTEVEAQIGDLIGQLVLFIPVSMMAAAFLLGILFNAGVLLQTL